MGRCRLGFAKRARNGSSTWIVTAKKRRWKSIGHANAKHIGSYGDFVGSYLRRRVRKAIVVDEYSEENDEH
jgi:hypothetical protein